MPARELGSKSRLRRNGRPRVWHLFPQDGLGGAETAARSMAFAGNLQCEFRLLFMRGTPLVQNPNVLVLSQAKGWLGTYMPTLRSLLQEPPDILICSLWRTMPIGIFFALFVKRTKVVCMLHSARPAHIVDNLLSFIARKTAAAIWVDSTATYNRRLTFKERQASKIVSFVTKKLDRVTEPESPGRPNFICWGRLSKWKGLERSLDFIALMVQRHSCVRFDIWGPDDGELERIKRRIDELELHRNVSIKGPLDHEKIAEVSKDASFFLQLSHREGMAMAVVEAMQLGLVPVVTAVGEISNYCIDNVNSIIVAPANLERSVSAVCNLIDNKVKMNSVRDSSVKSWIGSDTYAEQVDLFALEVANRKP